MWCEGLLVQKLALVAEQVVGIDPDPKAIQRAKSRLSDTPNAIVECADFIEYKAVPESFDAIVFVASLHHMDAETALRKARELLAPNGKVLIVGCAKNGKLTDWLIDIGRTPFAWIGTKLHGETNPGVVTRNPTVTFDEMRSLAKTVFAKARIRRGLYYRYLLIVERGS